LNHQYIEVPTLVVVGEFDIGMSAAINSLTPFRKNQKIIVQRTTCQPKNLRFELPSFERFLMILDSVGL
jgi:hypothetical protein